IRRKESARFGLNDAHSGTTQCSGFFLLTAGNHRMNYIRRMHMWPNDRFIKLCGIDLPIIQAPMAGAALSDMVVAVSEAGGLGSLAWSLPSLGQARKDLEIIRQKTSRPINANFFCHQSPRADSTREMNWRRRLDAYYIQLQADAGTIPGSARSPFDDKMCD